MKSLLLALFATTALAELPQGEIVFHTRDGKTIQGRVLSETSSGYLVTTPKGTKVIAFTAIADMKTAGEEAPAPAAQPTVHAPSPAGAAPAATVSAAPAAVPQYAQPVAAPTYAQPVATPVYQQPAPAQPVYATPVATPVYQQPAPAQPVYATPIATYSTTTPPPSATTSVAPPSENGENERLGFHAGLGFGAMVLPLDYALFSANLQFNLDFTFGVVGLRISPGLWLRAYGSTYLAPNVDTKLQLNIGEHFALGFGLEFGFALGGASEFYLGPSLAPVIVKLGTRAQHQISLQASLPVLHIGGYGSGGFSTPLLSLGYNYLF